MSQLIPFQFEAHAITIHLDEAGQPWWEAQDVCVVLGIRDVSKAVARLKLGEKRTSESRNVLIINEKGLYRLIMRSNKPEAERFQDWVFGEVLPQIRKTGQYIPKPSALDAFPEMRAMVALMENVAEQRLMIEEMREAQRQQDAKLIATQQQTIEALQQSQRADAKADMALDEARRMTLEDFVYSNGLARQLPLTPQAIAGYVTFLAEFCQHFGLPYDKEPVYGKQWRKENTYPVPALTALLRHETHRPRQIRLYRQQEEG